MKWHRTAVAVLVLALAGCGNDSGSGSGGSTGPSPSYESIAGTYLGVMVGTASGVALSANFTLTVTQASGTLGGSYGLTGTLTDGVTTLPISGTGAITGSLSSGANPPVSVTVHPAGCPSRAATFTGSYDSTSRRLTMAGPVEMFGSDCVVFLAYPMTIVLARSRSC